MNLKIRHTDSSNKDFKELINLLDDDLNERYGELQKQYDRYNHVDSIPDVIVIYQDDKPAACGAFKVDNEDSIELKRIFVKKDNRRQGLAAVILRELEESGRKKGYRYALLETGKKQFEAIALYQKSGYKITENFGSYAGNANSICMRKDL